MITTDERIIIAITVADGAYVDGTRFEKLLESTLQSGLDVEEVYGDKAYFRRPILDKINGIKAKPYIPVSAMVYRIDEEKFSYNKDSDEWFCSQGNKTIRKRYAKRKDGRQLYTYYFEKEKCENCLNRAGCITPKTKARTLSIGINTTEFYKYSQEQKEPEFKEKYKNRSCQEWKNGEMKNHHGLDCARGYGLRGMSTQAKLTAIVVNLKRIANILSSKLDSFLFVFRFKLVF